MNRRGTYFVVAGGFAIAAALTLVDYGDSPRDIFHLAFVSILALVYLVLGLRTKSETR